MKGILKCLALFEEELFTVNVEVSLLYSDMNTLYVIIFQQLSQA